MSTLAVLENLQLFLRDSVAPNIKLQKPSDDDVLKYELVNPAVHIGWIPPKGYIPEELKVAIPCLVVGMDDASNDSQEGQVNIRITAAVYSPGLHKPGSRGALDFTPDFQGYCDLLNLIDRTVAELYKNRVISNAGAIGETIKWGMYDQEQPYPYWYGWIIFPITKAPARISKIVHDLL